MEIKNSVCIQILFKKCIRDSHFRHKNKCINLSTWLALCSFCYSGTKRVVSWIAIGYLLALISSSGNSEKFPLLEIFWGEGEYGHSAYSCALSPALHASPDQGNPVLEKAREAAAVLLFPIPVGREEVGEDPLYLPPWEQEGCNLLCSVPGLHVRKLGFV